jgi:hypothetical protein
MTTQSKKLAMPLTVIATAIAALALLAPAASAAEPNPGYGQFVGCPDATENPAVELCIRSEITGGHLQMGKKDVPIKNPVVLTGGTDGDFKNFTANSKGGLTKVKQEVPGGIIGLTGLDWLINFLGLEGLKLYGVTELAGAPTNFSFGGFTIPIKVHLINPVLGNNCYVGSVSNPITLNLTVGTTNPPPPNEPISGVPPKLEFDVEKEIIELNDGTYVDNAFAAPGASGCVLTLFGFIPISINGLVNSQSGLPSPAGTNEVVQESDLEFTERDLVY